MQMAKTFKKIKYLEMIKIAIFFFWMNADLKENKSDVKTIKKRSTFVCSCDERKVFH